jgi:hypothetical protein
VGYDNQFQGAKAKHAIEHLELVTRYWLDKDANPQKLIHALQLNPTICDADQVIEAMRTFKDLPGIFSSDSPLMKVLQNGKLSDDTKKLGTAKGAMYELKKALDLVKVGEIVERIGIKVKFILDGKSSFKEFDIQTSRYLIDCKDINWMNYSVTDTLPDGMKQVIKEEAKRLQLSFIDHKEVANTAGKEFAISSKNLIPEIWQAWFRESDITFFQDV